MPVNMIAVESSNIARVGHNEDHDKPVMFVQFKNGGTYRYENVPVATFKEIVEAESVGKVFNALVKKFPDAYPFTKVGE